MTTLTIAEQLHQLGRSMAGNLVSHVDRGLDAEPSPESMRPLTTGEQVVALRAALEESYRLRIEAEAERDHAIRARDAADLEALNLRHRMARDGIGTRAGANA
jgi:hypothetical protein